MKANLILYFDHDENPDADRNPELAELLMNFGLYCEEAYFTFQTLPRIGEYIVAEPLLREWIGNKKWVKPCLGDEALRKIHKALCTGSFRVEEIYHHFDTCTIHCSDIRYKISQD